MTFTITARKNGKFVARKTFSGVKAKLLTGGLFASYLAGAVVAGIAITKVLGGEE